MKRTRCSELAGLHFSLYIGSTNSITFTDTSYDDDKCPVMFVYAAGYSTKGIVFMMDRKNGYPWGEVFLSLTDPGRRRNKKDPYPV